MESKDLLKNENNNKTSRTKLGIIYCIGFVICSLLACQVATQTVARNTDYWEGFASYAWQSDSHFYKPWAVIVWYFEYGDDKDLFTEAINNGFSTLFASVTLFLLGFIAARNKLKAIETLHGSAHWASEEDIKNCGLLNEKHDGKPFVYVGGYKDKRGKFHFLTHSGPEHILCYAPTRSGKGVGLVIPSLISWSASTVVTDLKGELWALTAGHRKTNLKQQCIKFEPAAATSAKWNPLDEIRLGTDYEVSDSQNLANMIVDPDGKGLDGQDGHWKKTAFALFTGMILHVLYKAKYEGTEASLKAIDSLLADPTKNITETYKEMCTYKHIRPNPQDPETWTNHAVIGAAGKDQLDRPEEEGGSVLSTVKSYLSLFRDPIVAENTRRSDFHVRDIMNYDTPVSVYVVTQPSDKARLKPLVRIFVNMVVRILASEMKFVNGRAQSCNKYKLLMMLDEFPSLGKLDIMQESLAFVAGYGIKCYLITQDLSQLKNDYGQNESITSNCHIQNAYPPNRMETAEYLSKMTGQTTIVKKSITRNGSDKLFGGTSSMNLQEVQRPLLTPDECMRLKGARKNSSGDIEEAGDMLVFVAGFPAIYGKQILYFQHEELFCKYTKIAAPEVTDSLYPTEKQTETKQISEAKDDLLKNSNGSAITIDAITAGTAVETQQEQPAKQSVVQDQEAQRLAQEILSEMEKDK